MNAALKPEKKLHRTEMGTIEFVGETTVTERMKETMDLLTTDPAEDDPSEAIPERTAHYTATKNACKLCSPLGAALVFKGIRGAVPLLHGSQGCSTYIRRYLISHYKEPVDIACTNFAEETAIFGGGANLKVALENIRNQYDPELIGIATTCLSETIGDDVPMFLHEYRKMTEGQTLPPMVHVSTPSYQGTHMQGFHGAVEAVIRQLAEKTADEPERVNIFPGMASPEDLRHLTDILEDFGAAGSLLPDYSDTLDGPLWSEYHRIPEGGTPVEELRRSANAAASIEFGQILAGEKKTAATFLESEFGVTAHRMGLPMGIHASDRFFSALSRILERPVPLRYRKARGRLTDAYVDGHKYVNGLSAVVYGEEDLVAGLCEFLSEIGIRPVVCASGGRSGRLTGSIRRILSENQPDGQTDRDADDILILEDADFVDIESAVTARKPDLVIGSSKGYGMARRLDIPLIRVGFPVHDRFDGARTAHYGYQGTQRLFDRIVNTVIDRRQTRSDWGYSYI